MRCVRNLAVMLVILPTIAPDVPACSTFTLGKGDEVYVGRNLDERFLFDFLVVVNKRGVRKESRSFAELMTGKPSLHVPVSWVSQYASITLNGSSAEFPEGGINEAGLVFEEMTLAKTRYPFDENRATFFMELWIQYVLDTCATVEEVIASAKTVSIDGWAWHFMAVDASGSSAVIEFIDGEPVIRTGDSLPYPLLCNSTYSEELEKLAGYAGYGGTETLDMESPVSPGAGDIRFPRGVVLLKGYDPAGAVSPVDFAFATADAITTPEWSLVQKVYDINRRRMYFRTKRARDVRWVDLRAFDLGCGSPRMVLFAHENLEGDVSAKFEPLTEVAGRSVLEKFFEALGQDPGFEAEIKAHGATVEAIIDRHIAYPETTRCLCTQSVQDREKSDAGSPIPNALPDS